MYELITWPEIQDYMECEGFREHSCLADDEYFFDSYGSSAYFVDAEWLKEVRKEMTVINYSNYEIESKN